VAEYLKTAEQDPLHLIAFLQDGKLAGIYVAGDTISIAVPVRTVESAVFTLLASYFVFNVDYPRQYAMFFAVVQSLVLEQPYLKLTSKKYAFLMKKLRQAMRETPDTSDEEEPRPKKQATKRQNRSDGDASTSAGKQMISDSAVATVSLQVADESHAETNKEETAASTQPSCPVIVGSITEVITDTPADNTHVGSVKGLVKPLPKRARRGKNKKYED